MPLFAVLFGSIINALVSLFVRYLSVGAAVKLAAYTTLVGIFAAFLVTVYVCLNSLYTMLSTVSSGGGTGGFAWVSMFWMGLGMFIPANAGAVLACIGSVWIGTGIYCFQRDSIRVFAH